MRKLFLLITVAWSALMPENKPNQDSLTNNSNTPTITVVDVQSGDFDCCSGNEEDPALYASVETSGSNPVVGANVDVIDNNTSMSIGSTTTDLNGDFAVRVPVGDYYFAITPVGQSTVNTAVYEVDDDMTLDPIVI